MADFTSDGPRARPHTRRSAEFMFYFGLIFVMAIPFATVGWLIDVVRRQTLLLHGPLARAWAEADRITPLIFSA
ncbi:MAG: protein pufQ [Alphaproteobacteria bacterium HGW-Alphaproteobacteria-2]|nr:MAG: protein pufQ [Alphaproteobacteria bacterium HGW-Alphaproteobacteria-2]